jgi:hypothetical protein
MLAGATGARPWCDHCAPRGRGGTVVTGSPAVGPQCGLLEEHGGGIGMALGKVVRAGVHQTAGSMHWT